MSGIDPNDNRPYCPSCNKHVAPQVVTGTKQTGPTMIYSNGPVGQVIRNQQEIQTLYCSECGTEVLKLVHCNNCKIKTPSRAEYHRTSGWSWDQSAMSFCTVCNHQVSGPAKDTGITSGCFIATATMGSPEHSTVIGLREFRDTVLMNSAAGRRFISFYYKTSPPIAKWIEARKIARTIVKFLVVIPASKIVMALKK